MTDRFHRRLPFGAEPEEGAVRFRLWAPSAAAAAVVLEGEAAALAMEPREGGWHELTTPRARPGTRYRYRLSSGLEAPDPASRRQSGGVHGWSVVVDPAGFAWRHGGWRGRPWEETVLYELHIGTFSPEGTYAGARRRLARLAELGVTAVQIMPLADFSGTRGWGYDGVLPFAPAEAYGAPDDLKGLVDEAHGLGLMVFLDVVYNHFGPDGAYVHAFSPEFFTERHRTPWGAAVDVGRRPVRDFIIANALYWTHEYRFDGLRLDAVDRIFDDGATHILVELAAEVRATAGDRHLHLVVENDLNQAFLLERDGQGRARFYDAQWNDDAHHAFHVTLTGEADSYYSDYAGDPTGALAHALATGFVFQGAPSRHRGGVQRGEPSGHLPPTAFVNFLQNHDQVGNRAYGERLTVLAAPPAVEAGLMVLLLAPQIPMLFMGEEEAETRPFLFFCDFHDALADAVREGRRREFRRFPQFADEAARRTIPDPNAAATMEACRLHPTAGGGGGRRALVAQLLEVRRRAIVPRLAGMTGHAGEMRLWSPGLTVAWRLGDGARLTLLANLSGSSAEGCEAPAGDLLFASAPGLVEAARLGRMPAWSVLWTLDPAAGP
jgi:malto-oligosyltrehalose trehalohydrolase